jgi:hypothetical protein
MRFQRRSNRPSRISGKLFKKIGKAVKTVAGKAWQVAKKLGLGPIFNQIKALIRPLLNRVLQMAIGKLPEAVQAAAQKLAEKLGFTAPKPMEPAMSATGDSSSAGGDAATPSESVGSPVQATAGGDVSKIQQEFDERIAEALLAQDEVELNLEVARLQSASTSAATPVFANLDDARDQFIQELDNLKPGESPEPYVQNFLPAVLPVLRLGLRLAGRPRVVNFIAQLLAKLIAKLIGPEQAPALSQAIVDAGLKLLNLEMSEQEKSGLAASVVAATVEETVNRVVSLPDHILDNQELLEGYVLEAFEQAAAANLPAVLSEATYRQRPELLEAGVNAGWLLLPLRRRKRYKRCTRAFKIRITPNRKLGPKTNKADQKLAQEWTKIRDREVWAAIEKSAKNTELAVDGKDVASEHRLFWGPGGKQFKQLVEWAAQEVELDPGLLATALIAETGGIASYLTKSKVSTYLIGVDDFFAMRYVLAQNVPAYSKIGWDKKQMNRRAGTKNGRAAPT